MERKLFNDVTRKYQYFDKNGIEITAGMTLRHDNGDEDKVYECADEFGNGNLGFLASNPRFLENHPEWAAEYYPLHQFVLSEWQVVNGGCAHAD